MDGAAEFSNDRISEEPYVGRNCTPPHTLKLWLSRHPIAIGVHNLESQIKVKLEFILAKYIQISN